MKHLLFIFLYLTLSLPTFAQDYQIKWGETYTNDRERLFIGIEGDYYYMTHYTEEEGSALLQFDFNHQLVKEEKLNLTYKGEVFCF